MPRGRPTKSPQLIDDDTKLEKRRKSNRLAQRRHREKKRMEKEENALDQNMRDFSRRVTRSRLIEQRAMRTRHVEETELGASLDNALHGKSYYHIHIVQH